MHGWNLIVCRIGHAYLRHNSAGTACGASCPKCGRLSQAAWHLGDVRLSNVLEGMADVFAQIQRNQRGTGTGDPP